MGQPRDARDLFALLVHNLSGGGGAKGNGAEQAEATNKAAQVFKHHFGFTTRRTLTKLTATDSGGKCDAKISDEFLLDRLETSHVLGLSVEKHLPTKKSKKALSTASDLESAQVIADSAVDAEGEVGLVPQVLKSGGISASATDLEVALHHAYGDLVESVDVVDFAVPLETLGSAATTTVSNSPMDAADRVAGAAAATALQKTVQAVRRVKLSGTPPAHLVVHLRRFKFNGGGGEEEEKDAASDLLGDQSDQEQSFATATAAAAVEETKEKDSVGSDKQAKKQKEKKKEKKKEKHASSSSSKSKRHRILPVGGQVRLGHHVSFPRKLDLTPFVDDSSGADVCGGSSQQQPWRYVLSGVVVHERVKRGMGTTQQDDQQETGGGRSSKADKKREKEKKRKEKRNLRNAADSDSDNEQDGGKEEGHYYSFVREKQLGEDGNERWFKCNDEEVTPWAATDEAFKSCCFGMSKPALPLTSPGVVADMVARGQSFQGPVATMLFFERVPCSDLNTSTTVDTASASSYSSSSSATATTDPSPMALLPPRIAAAVASTSAMAALFSPKLTLSSKFSQVLPVSPPASSTSALSSSSSLSSLPSPPVLTQSAAPASVHFALIERALSVVVNSPSSSGESPALAATVLDADASLGEKQSALSQSEDIQSGDAQTGGDRAVFLLRYLRLIVSLPNFLPPAALPQPQHPQHHMHIGVVAARRLAAILFQTQTPKSSRPENNNSSTSSTSTVSSNSNSSLACLSELFANLSVQISTTTSTSISSSCSATESLVRDVLEACAHANDEATAAAIRDIILSPLVLVKRPVILHDQGKDLAEAAAMTEQPCSSEEAPAAYALLSLLAKIVLEVLPQSSSTRSSRSEMSSVTVENRAIIVEESCAWISNILRVLGTEVSSAASSISSSSSLPSESVGAKKWMAYGGTRSCGDGIGDGAAVAAALFNAFTESAPTVTSSSSTSSTAAEVSLAVSNSHQTLRAWGMHLLSVFLSASSFDPLPAATSSPAATAADRSPSSSPAEPGQPSSLPPPSPPPLPLFDLGALTNALALNLPSLLAEHPHHRFGLVSSSFASFCRGGSAGPGYKNSSPLPLPLDLGGFVAMATLQQEQHCRILVGSQVRKE
jgi:hypothetical protein